MNSDQLFVQMTANAERIQSLTIAVMEEQARWKPDQDAWSILEVINHLYDEERADFRVRLDCILHRPDQPWPPIDPAGWVTERKYNQRDLSQSTTNFLQEREKSLVWLKALSTPNWGVIVAAPFGQIAAGDMFAAWVAHDLLHIRQLVELHWLYTLRSVQPFRVEYAGEW
ncbi:MAG: DinB family protein [Anaerolineaceae bacterium]|nr:DinB family protein [Anaerolineaceae bacterium]